MLLEVTNTQCYSALQFYRSPISSLFQFYSTVAAGFIQYQCSHKPCFQLAAVWCKQALINPLCSNFQNHVNNSLVKKMALSSLRARCFFSGIG